MQVVPYITFNGNCREAMTFYKGIFGGKLSLQTVGESPLAGKLPEEMKLYILHAALEKKGFSLFATDMAGNEGLSKGNNISVTVSCDSEEQVRSLYKKLCAGGTATHPIENTFWDALFGGLTDKFGIKWLLHYKN